MNCCRATYRMKKIHFEKKKLHYSNKMAKKNFDTNIFNKLISDKIEYF